MMNLRKCLRAFSFLVIGGLGFQIAGCAGPSAETLPWISPVDYNYIIGPGDNILIFVWRNPDLTRAIPVRPDGRISVPLVEDLEASGKTSTQLAREIEGVLSRYVREPLVTVIVTGFVGVYETQVRVVGAATDPRALLYNDDMTLLDVMIAVGGLNEFASGNRTQLVRTVDGEVTTATVRVEDLVLDGDISANIPVAPGDIIIIPEAWF
jgi:polysaccharide biosynthesis/export protein